MFQDCLVILSSISRLVSQLLKAHTGNKNDKRQTVMQSYPHLQVSLMSSSPKTMGNELMFSFRCKKKDQRKKTVLLIHFGTDMDKVGLCYVPRFFVTRPFPSLPNHVTKT
jgi:hypothetical protein